MSEGRNELCPCGSGKKHKACCANKKKNSSLVAIIGVTAFLLGGIWAITYALQNSGPPEGMVWDADHGHYHPIENAEPEQPTEQSIGLPDGAVWSEEHGHYHDASGEKIEVSFDSFK